MLSLLWWPFVSPLIFGETLVVKWPFYGEIVIFVSRWVSELNTVICLKHDLGDDQIVYVLHLSCPFNILMICYQDSTWPAQQPNISVQADSPRGNCSIKVWLFDQSLIVWSKISCERSCSLRSKLFLALDCSSTRLVREAGRWGWLIKIIDNQSWLMIDNHWKSKIIYDQ